MFAIVTLIGLLPTDYLNGATFTSFRDVGIGY